MLPPTPETRFELFETPPSHHEASFAEEVESGLTARQKSLPCRFLYDAAGSKLFEAICGLSEYYLTRAEAEILEKYADEIAGEFPEPVTLAELGSGNSSKTRLLIESLLRTHGDLRYVPIDISREILRESAECLLYEYGDLEVRAIASDYEDGLRHIAGENGRPKLIAWLGSSIGNLTPDEAREFLEDIRGAMGAEDRALVGIDLRKEGDVLEAAYDDPQGVTARFSLNLLERMNRELAANFDISNFRHEAVWREDEGRVAIRIVSTREQSVSVEALDLEVEFREGEGIQTEDAFKYSLPEIDALARDSGLRVASRWLDAESRFSVNLLATN